MLSLQLIQLPTVSPVSVPNNEMNIPFPSLIKLCSSTAGKRSAEGARASSHHHLECFSTSVSGADAIIDEDDESRVIQLLPGDLRADLMPKHVALLMDGFGRWAKNRGLPIQHGHKAGSINLKHIISSSCQLGIQVFTVFAFSTENWNRSKVEIELLMRFIEDFIRNDVKELIERYGIKFSAIGNRSKLPESLQSAISSAEESSKWNKGMHLVSALSYSGRYDIVEAVRKIASKVEDGDLGATEIDESVLEQQLATSLMEFPNPDLLIRTSGELRVSNFMLWQLAYTEFYFSDKPFPDFRQPDLIHAIASFQQRQRRFGQRLN